MAETSSGRIHLDRKELGILIAGQVLGFAGFLVDDFIPLVAMLACSWAALIYVCVNHDGKPRFRILFGMLATVMYGVIAYSNYVSKYLKTQHTSVVLRVSSVQDNGKTVGLDPFVLGEIPSINVAYLNHSDKVALENPNLGAVLAVVELPDVPGSFANNHQRVKYIGESSNVVPLVKVDGVSLIQAPFHTFTGTPLSGSEAKGLEDGTKALCVISSLLWKDKSGSYETQGNTCYMRTRACSHYRSASMMKAK
jgi:hypothetical protein